MQTRKACDVKSARLIQRRGKLFIGKYEPWSPGQRDQRNVELKDFLTAKTIRSNAKKAVRAGGTRRWGEIGKGDENGE